MEPKSILTGEGTVPVQAEIPGTEQERIPAIETAADKFDAANRLLKGLKDEAANAQAKLVETMHLHEAGLSKDGEGTMAYVRGDYRIVVSQKESIKVTIAKAKGPEGDDAGELDDDATGEEN
jgi:hypothetical protein